MNPASADVAGRQAYELMRRHFRGASAATKRRRYRVAALIAESVWKRWQVGVRRWRQKHVHWYLSHGLRNAASNTKYQHYLAIRDLVYVLGKGHWLRHLDGPWVRPNGERGPLGSGRPATLRGDD